jgi:hypothetical protein
MLRAAAFIVAVVACVRGLSENGVCPNSDAACTQDARFEDDNTYKFNVRTLSGAHPAVKPLEEKYKATTSMNAKIRLSRCWSSVNHSPNLFCVRYVRSLVPGRVDIWYDDGEGGTEQGHLSMGQVCSTIALDNVCLVTVLRVQETTTNSYEGHTFFFTTAGNKSNEVARVTMVKDQVHTGGSISWELFLMSCCLYSRYCIWSRIPSAPPLLSCGMHPTESLTSWPTIKTARAFSGATFMARMVLAHRLANLCGPPLMLARCTR